MLDFDVKLYSKTSYLGFLTFYGLFLSESLALNTDRTSAEMAAHLMDKF